MIISLKNKLYLFYLFIIGIIIIVLNLYFRIFRSRETYSLEILRDNLSIKVILFSVGFIFIHILIIISVLYYMYKKYYNIQKESKLIQNISIIVDNLYWKPLEYIHDLIAPDLPYSGMIIVYITEFLEKGNTLLRYKLYRHSYILFEYLPQILVSSVFFIEVVIYNQMHYFLYCIILLLLPLIYKIYLKLCMSFVIRNRPEFLEVLDITPLGEPDENGVYLNFKFSLKSNYVQDKDELQDCVRHYLNLERIELHINAIKKNSAKYYIYIVLFTSSLYLSAAAYRLIYILF